MAQYIDKAAVVAEIERRKKQLIEHGNEFHDKWACGSLDTILSFLDTIEVKEVNLEEELSEVDRELKEFIATDEFEEAVVTHDTWWVIAKHFFEFGAKWRDSNLWHGI